MKKAARQILITLFAIFIVNSAVYPAFAQETPTPAPATPTPTPVSSIQLGSSPGEPNWQIDARVTQVGRNAERARELVYWVYTHPLRFTAPVIAQTWTINKYIAYVMTVFVIIGLAIHLLITRKNIGPTFTGISLGFDNVNLYSIIVRVASMLIFVTFSYILVLGLIQGAEILSRFFIEHLGGQDLFNIIFSGGNTEGNYAFIGYRNADPLEHEMVSTSLFLVQLTSFTYNFMSVILILRHVILLFLLIISPFLALILPFIFIRNTGFIWIGEFLRWLFYGPLFALFISALAKIWKAGIPYSFDFSRARAGEMVYQTGINILYGGPSQVLTPTNTVNYVDTYAEYIIALVMLWTAMLLPWLLLRIFRDYCCDILQKNQGVLLQMLDKLKNITPPPSPKAPTPAPAATFGRKMKVPETKPSVSTRVLNREKIIEKINQKDVKNISTTDIKRVFDLSVASLRDVARIETRKDAQNTVQQTLSNIQNPLRVSDPKERVQYENLRNEFSKRASQGDEEARRVIQAATPLASHIKSTIGVSSNLLRESVKKPGVPVAITEVARIPTIHTIASSVVNSVSHKTNMSKDRVEQILKAAPLAGKTIEEKTNTISEKMNVPKEQVREVLKTAGVIAHVRAPSPHEIAQKTNVPQHTVESILSVAAKIPETAESRVEKIAHESISTKEQVQRVVNEMPKGEAGEKVETVPVSIEEYEEIRHMWMNHYANSEVPVSETIQSRSDWIAEDIKSLTNTLDLLTSSDEKDRRKGMEQVSSLLPFLLLGGFSDLEMLTYIKAKLEAAKLVQDELEKVEEAKEQVRKEEEETEYIPAVERKEEEETEAAAEAQEMPLPEKPSGLEDTPSDSEGKARQQGESHASPKVQTTTEIQSQNLENNQG